MPIELGETEAEKLAMLTEKSLDDIAINDRQPPGVSQHVAHESTKHKPSQSSVQRGSIAQQTLVSQPEKSEDHS